MDFKRHTINDVHSTRFYQLPKFLFDGEFKTMLSAEVSIIVAEINRLAQKIVKENTKCQ